MQAEALVLHYISYTTYAHRHINSPTMLLFADFKYCMVYDTVSTVK